MITAHSSVVTFRSSHRQFNDLFAFFDAHGVVVEEVDVESGLKNTREDLSPAVEVVNVEPVDPVQDVEEPVEAQSGHVVRGDVLYQSDFVQHYDLRDKRN